jgi:peptidoglycan/LPS O-acetylase OafA/YrhL
VSCDAIPRGLRWERAVRVSSTVAIALLSWTATMTTGSGLGLYRGGFTLIALAVAVVILDVFRYRPRPLVALLESTPLVLVGRLSYGLYLWHFPIFSILKQHALTSLPSTNWLAAVGLTLAVTAASFYGVEQPALRVKARLRASG